MDWTIVTLPLWVIAGAVSFYFSLGNARVWTSIAVGFFLILIAEILPTAITFLPGLEIPQVQAMTSIVGTIAVLVMSHGFQELRLFQNFGTRREQDSGLSRYPWSYSAFGCFCMGKL